MESKYNKETYCGKQFQWRPCGGLLYTYTIMEDKVIPDRISGYVTEFSCALYPDMKGVDISLIEKQLNY